MNLVRLLLIPVLFLPPRGAASAQEAAPAAAPLGPFAALFDQLLTRSSNGHSPTPEDIAALTSAPVAADGAALREALPLIEKALDNPDVPVRTYTLTALAALQDPPATAPEPAAMPADPGAAAKPDTQTVAPPPVGPATYNASLQKVLGPAIPRIAAHLTEESQPNRLLTAAILGGFLPNPPSAVYPPLLAYLKRDDAVSAVGLAVVQDLLQLAPIGPDTAAAISTYIRRSDQTADARANLIDGIASAANQSQSLNKTLLVYLDADDPSLRARTILSLPQLDLSADVFADTKSRIDQLAANDGENLQVNKAAKAVSPCWTAVRMTSGCPVYQ
jgi:hypothetical protein